MRVIYVRKCRTCPCLVHVSCGVKCFYGPPVSSLLGDLDSISPDCPLAEAPTAETGGSVGDTAHNTGSPKLPPDIKEKFSKWVAEQTIIPPLYAKIVNDNFWDLL